MQMPDLLAKLIAHGRPWLHEYGLWAVFFGLFTETFLFTGLWVPGLAILLAAGYLTAAHELPLIPTLLLAWSGAMLGDQTSYLLGMLSGKSLLRRKEKVADALKQSLEKQGIALLLTYHYFPPLRALLPCVAGSVRYPFRGWFMGDTLGILLWATVYMLLGYCAFGTLRQQGNMLLEALNIVVSLLVLALIWRIGVTLRHLYKTAANSDTPKEEEA